MALLHPLGHLDRASLRVVAPWVLKHWLPILFYRVPLWVSRAQPGSPGEAGTMARSPVSQAPSIVR